MNLKKIKLSEWHDSNIRPPIPKTGTLPTALHSEKVEILLKKAASTKQEEVIKKAAKIKNYPFCYYVQKSKYGRNALSIAQAGLKKRWNIKRQHSSKIDTACFELLPAVKIL